MFILFWVSYRHNYYYVQRVKIDTHGLLFNNALSQLFAGIYILEISLIGLFFLVRDVDDHVICTPQAIIMIIVLILTAAFHFVMEQHLSPLYDLLPVSLEDSAVEAEQRLSLLGNGNPDSPSMDGIDDLPNKLEDSRLGKDSLPDVATAANARSKLSRMKIEVATKVAQLQARIPEPIDKSRRRQVAEQLGAAIAGYPDELTDLSHGEREAELKAAFQDPVTRETRPVIWLPQDVAGCSDDAIKQVKGYGKLLQYSNTGAYLTSKGKCEVVQPAPDVRPDWLLEWVL